MVRAVSGVVIGGRYRLEEEIGRGGMGAVWRGHDDVLRRPVAVKRVAQAVGLDDDTAYRATREARLAATLSHPHVVAMLDLVREGDQVWLVMEYVESRNLTELVRRDGPLDPDTAADLLGQVADALAAAHRAGIVHRDVKPSNLLVTPDGQVKLSDFGIARARGDETLTRTGLVVGSPAYLAPEVARGEPATEASDAWSFGVTAYFALTGEHAYETDNAMATLHRIVSESPPRLATAGWLAPLFDGTLVLDPERRWSLAEVATFLTRGGRPATTTTAVRRLPTVRPDEPPPPPDDDYGRDRRGGLGWGWVAAAVVVLALIAGGGWVLLGRTTSPSTTAGVTGPSTAPRTPRSPTTGTSPSPTTGATGATGGPTAAGMTAFVTTYLDTVTRDPAAGWALLTPAFQQASGGFRRYDRAWLARPLASARDIRADPVTRTVSYDVTYRNAQGQVTFHDRPTLTLSYADGGYKIAAEQT